MDVLTQVQADRLNETGVTEPYRAFNGHLMIAPVEFPPVVDPKDRYDTREYKVGDRIRYTSFNAWCAENCAACAEGDPLPDW